MRNLPTCKADGYGMLRSCGDIGETGTEAFLSETTTARKLMMARSWNDQLLRGIRMTSTNYIPTVYLRFVEREEESSSLTADGHLLSHDVVRVVTRKILQQRWDSAGWCGSR